ncbi:recombinase family protein [Flagellimonas pacifica]|uniref:Site-specific DNA recombinase n=1 Tax=Flagellimonas pacifica TaxID=1247520 RepID=A0A285MZJ9_9FLAO|nr:recombinase family protein [Allomuricauda parva]SNZ01226.1 Site-specific DNA recombinase [Allomuricauda parva]
MTFGYARVSTKSQKHDLQVDAFLKEGIDAKNIYADISSGAKSERKGLDELLSKLREGDTVVVWKMDRIARSLSHLVKLIEDFESRGIHFKSIQENFIDTCSPHGKFVFNLFASIAQLERDIIIERTRAGLESSRRRGVRLGRQPGLSKKAQHKAILAEKYYRENKLSVEEIMKLIEVGSKRTLYKYLALQGRRTCKECEALFWDKHQAIDSSFCTKHRRAKSILENNL